MPDRPKRPCRKPGCPNLATSGYCDDHGGEVAVARRRYDDSRGNATERGYDAAWAKVRNQAMRRDNYLCQMCLDEDKITVATEVHHLVPVKIDPSRLLDVTNCLSVCHPHHLLAEERIRKGF